MKERVSEEALSGKEGLGLKTFLGEIRPSSLWS